MSCMSLNLVVSVVTEESMDPNVVLLSATSLFIDALIYQLSSQHPKLEYPLAKRIEMHLQCLQMCVEPLLQNCSFILPSHPC